MSAAARMITAFAALSEAVEHVQKGVVALGQVLTEGQIDVEQAPRLDDESEDFTGWFCIATDPWRCSNCGLYVDFMTAAHYIIVWPEKDDPDLLFHANVCKEVGRNPRVIEYEYGQGPCVSYYYIQARGYPTCAHLKKGFA